MFLELFYLSPVAEAKVDKIISNFRDSAAGWDELKPSIIKTVKDSINIPLAHIGNLFFWYWNIPRRTKHCQNCAYL